MKKLLIVFLAFTGICFGNLKEDFEVKLNTLDLTVDSIIDNDPSNLGIYKAMEFKYNELNNLIEFYSDNLLSTLSGSQKKNFINSQKRWIKLKDKEFKFIDEFYGEKDGSIWNLYIIGDKVDFLRVRLEQIIKYLSIYYDEF